MILFAAISINMALVFYSIAVWGEKLQGSLKWRHAVLFWIGLLFVLMNHNQKMKLKFHKLSILVWFIWLIPFISGAVFGMMGQ